MPKKVNVLDNFVTWIEKNALMSIALALTQNVLRLRLFQCKIFFGCKIFSGENIFGCEIFSGENIFGR